MKDASLIVRYETSKYYVRNYVTTTTLLRMVALNEKRSALRPLSYSVESYVLLHRTHTHTNKQTNKQKYKQTEIQIEAHARTEVYSFR